MNDTSVLRHHLVDVSEKHIFISIRHQDYLLLDCIKSLIQPDDNPSLGQVKSIDISHRDIAASIVNPSFKYTVNTSVSRDCAIESLNFLDHEPFDRFLIYNSCSLISKSFPIFDLLDFGANAGWYSLAIASKLPIARVFSFEPVPSTFNLICKNIELNLCSDRITPNNFAIHEYQGTADF